MTLKSLIRPRLKCVIPVPSTLSLLNKLFEEHREVFSAIHESEDSMAHFLEECGDLIHTIALLCVALQVDPDKVLRFTKAKFKKRCAKVNKLVKEGKAESLAWHEAKHQAVTFPFETNGFYLTLHRAVKAVARSDV